MTKKVLIVEDEFIVANDLQLILEQAGYKVTGIAASSEEAEENIQQNKPDIVLLDIRLQGKLSGIDLARKLRSENIAFVYLSANSGQKILEEAKTTDPYGFLVKPFRERDLLVTLDIALYRHQHSFESKLRQEEVLQQKLIAICNESSTREQTLLNMTKGIQSYLPFDLIAVRTKSPASGKFDDIMYLRTGFDEYQFIGKNELLTITGLKEVDLPPIIEDSHTDMIIYNDEGIKGRPAIPAMHRMLLDTFSMRSYIVLPVTLNNRELVHYFFYNRQSGIYTKSHISLLSRLKTWLTDIAEKMSALVPSPMQAINHINSANKNRIEAAGRPEFNNIIGSHHLLLAALDLVKQVAPYNTSILILGESGTGKEKVAQSIHALSSRKKSPFVKVNCAAIPTTLIESELFGHEKGAFTGAIEKRRGKFEQAEGGTIFLDEIGELPLDMQAKLLRVLQEKEIEYVGGSSPLKVNVRIVAATNRNLEKEVSEGKFRLDLYYRLNVFPITLPALRERKSDIEALVLFFAKKFCKEFNKPFPGIAVSMMDEMLAYSWPGNIRELENVVEQSVILHNGRSMLELKRDFSFIATGHIPKPAIKTFEDVKHIQKETEREYIVSILKKTNGRIRGANGAAKLLNVKPTTLESRMAKLHIKREDFIM